MKMNWLNKLFLCFLLAANLTVLGQEKPSNTNSARPVEEQDIHYRLRLWRRMDLNEKVNKPFFSVNRQISKFLVDWVRAGILTPYKNDSLNVKLTLDQFNNNLMIDEALEGGGLSEAERSAGFGDENASTPAAKTASNSASGADDGWGTSAAPKKEEGAASPAADAFAEKPASAAAEFYFAKDLTIIEIKEDAIIDRLKSRLYFDIQSISLIIPASKTKAGFDKSVASFKYKDLYELFKSNPDCIWYNSNNDLQHKNMAYAFDLRLFSARIIKTGNIEDRFLSDLFGGDKQSLLQSQMIENKLLEIESSLWEY
jgi:hypothetical protein